MYYCSLELLLKTPCCLTSMHGWQTCYREFCRGVRLGLRCFSSSPLQNPSKGWQVSSHGRCCSSRGVVSDGCLHPNGYRYVTICGQSWAVHRVVMLAFNGPPQNEQAWQVHHEDGDRANNRLDNLDYVTPSQNVLHSYARQSRGSNGPAISKPVMWRRRGTQNWTFCTSGTQAAEQLGMRQSTVSAVCRGKASNREFEIHFQETSPTTLTGEEWRPMLDPVIKSAKEWLVPLAVWCPKQDWLAKGHWRGQATLSQV